MDNLIYKSTRGQGKPVSASKAIIRGIAEDGGLFVPSIIPKIDFNVKEFSKLNYKELAYTVMSKFFTDFTEEELKNCIDKAYDDKFDTKEIAPVKKIGDDFFLELHHGPTLAFKDVALSILPHLLKTSVKKQGIDKEVLILTATSGDTGKAALQGFNNVEGTKIIVFYPEVGVSIVQKLQMTTHDGNNTFVVAIKGNFDDAQKAVKEIFTNNKIREQLDEKGFMFSSANSINIGRLIPQVVYYFSAYLDLYRKGEISEGAKINVVVPTGNFGDILAGYFAKSMGLPLDKLICASNKNKVLSDFINTGKYDRNRDFYVTNSPSMDILVSSNLERLLYFISGENPEKVNALMEALSTKGEYSIDEDMKNKLKDFYAGYASEAETCDVITDLYKTHKEAIDTHTAVAYSVYKKYKADTNDHTKTVILSTASPFKFPKAVMSSIDKKYNGVDEFELIKELSKIANYPIPNGIKAIDTKPQIHNTVCDKKDIKNVVLDFLKIK
ncbi:threonine synthase [Clostridium sp.]|uniref:threonine synthase n=1 Tax=Clostridium sp. TaxID=1506 RepID=UPI0025886822|nr:threonine synthase [Clostridium sp.]MDF2503836.1 threonine synthase [Clostridium sp.]